MLDAWTEWIKNGELEHYRAYLLSHPSAMNAATAEGVPAVRYAMYYGKPEMAALLVEMGAELDLFSAAALGMLDVVRDRLQTHPDLINALSSDGYPALGLACFFNHPDCVEYLLDQGAQVNQVSQNPQHVMPIHAAASARSTEITEMLLTNGADANAVESAGFTPLHAAAQNGDLEIARLLLDFGADPNYRNDAGYSPIDLARANHHVDLVELMSQNPS